MCRRWLGLIAVAFVAYTANGQNTPTIMQDIRREVRKTGEDGRLICTVKNPSGMQINVRWIKDPQNAAIILTKNDQVEVDIVDTVENGLQKYGIEVKDSQDDTGQKYDEYTLVVRSLQVNDDSRYMCRVSWQGEPEGVFKIGILEVQVPPTIYSRSSPNKIDVNQFSQVSLACIASGTPMPNITWTHSADNQLPKQHKVVFTATSIQGNPYVRSDLTLFNVTTDDAGPYRCKADNTVAPVAEYIINLNVRFASSVRVSQNVSDGVLSQDVYVDCWAKGSPAPTVSWYFWGKDGKSIPKDPTTWGGTNKLSHGAKYDFMESQRNGVFYYKLKIKTLNARDLGYYACLAKNDVGDAFEKVLVSQTNCIVNCGKAVVGASGTATASRSSTVLSILMLLTSLFILLSRA